MVSNEIDLMDLRAGLGAKCNKFHFQDQPTCFILHTILSLFTLFINTPPKGIVNLRREGRDHLDTLSRLSLQNIFRKIFATICDFYTVIADFNLSQFLR